MRILVVDDEEIKRVSLSTDLSERGHDIVSAASGDEAVTRLAGRTFDIVITDLRMPGLDGMELLERIKHTTASTHTEVIIMTAYGNIPLAVGAMKAGAYHFITKPFSNEELFPLLDQIERERSGRGLFAAASERQFLPEIETRIIGHSEAIREVKGLVELCTRTDANVLICGETGTGKDLLASVIHQLSPRCESPYIKVSCAVFPPSLVESELFGHEKGAFTGADRQKPGRFELAAHGTIYIDDVDDIPLEHQVKLLRVIEEKVFERVGSTRPTAVDVRVIASTKRNLADRIAAGAFRQDLFYRLKVLQISVPPLRERLEDLPLLVPHLLQRITNQKPIKVDPAVLRLLSSYYWPGNVRELAYTLERAYLLGEGTISVDILRAEFGETWSQLRQEPKSIRVNGFKEIIENTERSLLERALAASRGNKSEAARTLGMKLSTFRDKLMKHGLG